MTYYALIDRHGKFIEHPVNTGAVCIFKKKFVAVSEGKRFKSHYGVPVAGILHLELPRIFKVTYSEKTHKLEKNFDWNSIS